MPNVKKGLPNEEEPVRKRRGRRPDSEKHAREVAAGAIPTDDPIVIVPAQAPNEDEPEWLKVRRLIRVQNTNGTDPVSLPDPTTAAMLPPPAPGEFTGSLRERGVQKELAAAIINVNSGSVSQWIQSGSVRLTPDGFVPISEVRRKVIEVYKHKNRLSTVGSGEDTVDAKQRTEIAKANLAELEFAKASKLVVSRQAVKLKFADMAAVVKTRILSLPERLADELLGQTKRHEVLAILTKELTEALEGMARPFRLLTEGDDDDEKDRGARRGSREEVPDASLQGRQGQGRVAGGPGARG